MTKLETHPDAAIYPMLTGEELAILADDIKANGLRFTIKLTEDGTQIVDGRNRLAACEIAGVEPRFEKLNGEDPKAFIVSANLARRDLTKGQKAMAMAFHYPEAEKGGRGKKGKSEETSGFTQKRLSQARQILRHSIELAKTVLSGAKRFDEALNDVINAQKELGSADTQLAILKDKRSDLAELVADERLTLAAAYAAYEKDKADDAEREENRRETILRLADAAFNGAAAWSVHGFADDIESLLDEENFRAQFVARLRINPDKLPDIQRGAERLASLIRSITK